jgi:predicted Rossmann fold nucleotide-binding protein DprA/Smf involved in DNA uptake
VADSPSKPSDNPELSTAQRIIAEADNRLAEVRALIAPLQQEERELIEVVPSERKSREAAEESIKPAPVRRGPKPRTAPSSDAPPKKRRRRRGGTRSEQAVAFIADNPGANATDVAAHLKVKPNYLYRVLADLETEGQVKKDGKTYTAV